MERRVMRCPKCDGVLGWSAYSETISVMRCKSCYGMLLEPGMLEKIRAEVRADEYFDVGHPKVGRSLDAVHEFDCPSCGGPMQSAPDPAQTHIHVESCSSCGAIFLDAGELLDLSHDTLLERLWTTLSGRLGLR